MESQVFAYQLGQEEYVVRVNNEVTGFQKEKYCYDRFCSDDLPLPEVIEIGEFDTKHVFCITRRIPGITLQDSDEETLKDLAGAVSRILETINTTDIDRQGGFGPFNDSGAADFASWHEFLMASVDTRCKDWDSLFARDLVDRNTIFPVFETFKRLAESCPEIKCLVHGDFGSNNVLTDGSRITGVLDWESALYGDPLHDVAGSYFWTTWLECMRIQAEYFEATMSHVEHYRRRVMCYQLQCGLNEIHENAVSGDKETLNWVTHRTLQVHDVIKANEDGW